MNNVDLTVLTSEALEQWNSFSQEIKENIAWAYDRYGIEMKRVTCHDCPVVKGCEWAFDAYNTDGDCLALK